MLINFPLSHLHPYRVIFEYNGALPDYYKGVKYLHNNGFNEAHHSRAMLVSRLIPTDFAYGALSMTRFMYHLC